MVVFDCGASSTVYGTLKRDEVMTFEAGALPISAGKTPVAWVIRHGIGANPPAFSVGVPGKGNEPEGWVHVHR